MAKKQGAIDDVAGLTVLGTRGRMSMDRYIEKKYLGTAGRVFFEKLSLTGSRKVGLRN